MYIPFTMFHGTTSAKSVCSMYVSEVRGTTSEQLPSPCELHIHQFLPLRYFIYSLICLSRNQISGIFQFVLTSFENSWNYGVY